MHSPSLELRGLRRSFGELVAVGGLSVSVSAGRLFGFVGRNGSGKTTTMRMTCGLLAADGGAGTWRGAPIDARVRERIGCMPEERGVYPKMRVEDQLEYFAVLHGAGARARRARLRVGGGVLRALGRAVSLGLLACGWASRLGAS
jgi:ABC-2 type transport system ATP-binding protein